MQYITGKEEERKEADDRGEDNVYRMTVNYGNCKTQKDIDRALLLESRLQYREVNERTKQTEKRNGMHNMVAETRKLKETVPISYCLR